MGGMRRVPWDKCCVAADIHADWDTRSQQWVAYKDGKVYRWCDGQDPPWWAESSVIEPPPETSKGCPNCGAPWRSVCPYCKSVLSVEGATA